MIELYDKANSIDIYGAWRMTTCKPTPSLDSLPLHEGATPYLDPRTRMATNSYPIYLYSTLPPNHSQPNNISYYYRISYRIPYRMPYNIPYRIPYRLLSFIRSNEANHLTSKS